MSREIKEKDINMRYEQVQEASACLCVSACVCVRACVFMTSAGHSAYGPHLGTMGMENDWLDELPDCER